MANHNNLFAAVNSPRADHRDATAMMTPLEDPVRIMLPTTLATVLIQACTQEMDGCRWSAANVGAARAVLTRGPGQALLSALAARLDRGSPTSAGWAILALPARLSDEDLQVAAATVLAGLGTPFFSIQQPGTWLWIGQESSSSKDGASFGGSGAQALHVDAPNVETIPEYTSLLVLRGDPVGGGTSLLGDLHAAAAQLDDDDRAALREPVFFEGRADNLRGVGAPRMPFPVLETGPDGTLVWIRWAAKMVRDQRNTAHRAVLERFAAALAQTTVAVVLERGQLLIVDQRRIAHGRSALGPQQGLVDGTRRWIMQAKATFEPSAPVHQMVPARGEAGDA
jgi:TfdA family taurine catabolism dioxygenase TauD